MPVTSCSSINTKSNFSVPVIVTTIIIIIICSICRDRFEVVLGIHDFDNFENGGRPEVYDIEQIIVVRIHHDVI